MTRLTPTTGEDPVMDTLNAIKRIGPGAGITILGVLLVVSAALAFAVGSGDRALVGTWSCVTSQTGRVTGVDGYDPDATVPHPFDGLDDFDDGLAVYPHVIGTDQYDPFGQSLNVGNGTVSVFADGRFHIRGFDRWVSGVQTGTWSRNDGLIVITYNNENDRLRQLATDFEPGRDDAAVLQWAGSQQALFQTQVTETEFGYNVTLNSSREAFELRCLLQDAEPTSLT